MSRISLLEHPTAQSLLADAEVSAADVRGCSQCLQRFLHRYLPCFYRAEQREHAQVVLQGKLSKLERKTSEPIAYLANRERKPVQNFVGAGAWDDERVMTELRRHVAQELGDPDGVLVLDPSAFPKKGKDSCGVTRQWCGRLGKVDNCQLGVFLAYVTAQGYAPLDRQLYLPRDWAKSRKLRTLTHVPEGVKFKETWRIGLDLIDRSAADVPFAWVAGDDEFGRVTEFRAGLRQRGLHYVLDVPSNTLIRDFDALPEEGHRLPPWVRVDEWARSQPKSRWRKLRLRDGAKGPLVVWALAGWVQTKGAGGRVGAKERVVVLRTVGGESQTWYTVAHVPSDTSLEKVAEVHGRRHGVEEVHQAGKGEVGLGHYEVRSWVGWHHHMTLSLLALWFLILEKGRVGKKNPGDDGAAGPGDLRATAAAEPTEPPADRGSGQSSVTANGRGADLPLVQSHRGIPATAGAA